MDIGGARTNERMLMIKESERISEGRIKKKKNCELTEELIKHKMRETREQT